MCDIPCSLYDTALTGLFFTGAVVKGLCFTLALPRCCWSMIYNILQYGFTLTRGQVVKEILRSHLDESGHETRTGRNVNTHTKKTIVLYPDDATTWKWFFLHYFNPDFISIYPFALVFFQQRVTGVYRKGLGAQGWLGWQPITEHNHTLSHTDDLVMPIPHVFGLGNWSTQRKTPIHEEKLCAHMVEAGNYWHLQQIDTIHCHPDDD